MSLFPKAEAVIDATSLAEQLRAAAAKLDAIASKAPSVEAGTLRRQTYAIRIHVANALTEGQESNV